MNFTRKAFVAAMVFAAVAGTATAAAADRWIKIYNNTSVVLYRFYASPANSQNWGPDRMGNRQIPSGYNSTINLNSAPRGCSYDIRAEFKDGDVLEKYGIDICGGYQMTYSD